MTRINNFDVIIIGAGAAGLFCASQAAKRGRSVLVLDHAKKIGEKIRISGGGRCNFTNIHTRPENFLSQNPKFCVSALSRFTPQDFIKFVDQAGIKWHEKKLGQLFCDDSAVQIIDMLLALCTKENVTLKTGVSINNVQNNKMGFRIETQDGAYQSSSLIIATGGKSIPKIGATGYGYEIAKQFGLSVIETRAGLVPLTFEGKIKELAHALSGVSVEASVMAQKTSFREGFLFTHRGLSGPSILQISNYWKEGEPLKIDLCPDYNISEILTSRKRTHGGIALQQLMGEFLPKRLVNSLGDLHMMKGNLADWSDKKLDLFGKNINQWEVVPVGSEGYRTAEVTLGGVDTRALNSRTMEAKNVDGLYFIGEVVDVTGWLGGYNFQWAWASAFAAAQSV